MVLIDVAPSTLLMGLNNHKSPLVNKCMGLYNLLGLLHVGFEHWEKIRDLLFSELINFMDKIIPKKSRIII